ncbi:MAG: type II secretion system secretin GspD [Candidatus Hydrogenedens sp.]|nr:type II secretion system secretin GspD [Candidatus Hydrogenedens sp.]
MMRNTVSGRRAARMLGSFVLAAGCAFAPALRAQDDFNPEVVEALPAEVVEQPAEVVEQHENGGAPPAPAPQEYVEEDPYQGNVAPAPAVQPPAPAPPRVPTRTVTTAPRSSRPMAAPPGRSGRSLPTAAAPPTAVQAPPPTTGPAAARAAIPNEEKTGETPAESVSFDFHDAPLYDVIDTISRLTGRNFDVDPNVSAITVTLITHDRIPPEMAYEVLESILNTRGYSMVESLDGHLVKVLPLQDAPTSGKTPLVRGDDKLPSGYDAFSTHIVTVKYSDGAEVQQALRILGTRNAQIDVYAPTNTLIMTDTAEGIRRMLTFLEDVDVPGLETNMEIFTLEYTRAEVLMNQLNQVLLEEGAAGGAAPRPGPQPMAPTPVRPVRTTTTRPVTAPGSSQVIGSRVETLRMVPDERLNSLIVVASDGMMAKVRDLVKRLDTPTPYEANNMHIYQLLNADAEAIEQALQPLIGTAPRKQATGGAAPAGGGGGGGGGGGAIAEVQPFEQKVQINRYDQTNSLLIVASPQDYKLLEAFIARLDVPQRQVCVDAVVMDVTISNDVGVTVDAASVNGRDGFGLTNTANLNKIATTAQTATEIVGGRRAALGAALLGMGTEGGLTTGVFDDVILTIDGKRYRVPFVPLLLQAIEKISDVEVLSQPSLVTLDNEEATIVVGQEVPFITSTSSSRRTDGTPDIGSYGGYTRVERQEVGIKLKVTPQISEGDNVLVQTEIEISDTDATQIGTVDIVGPTTNKSVVTNKSLVKDGSTAVIAGLIRDSSKRDRTQPPILGDIPVIGWLFSSKSDRREKRNMVVLLTPHIVKEGMDLDRLTQSKVNDYYDSNVQELFNAGFFKKVTKKHDMRKNYRPTMNRSEALTGRSGGEPFRRGDVSR